MAIDSQQKRMSCLAFGVFPSGVNDLAFRMNVALQYGGNAIEETAPDPGVVESGTEQLRRRRTHLSMRKGLRGKG